MSNKNPKIYAPIFAAILLFLIAVGCKFFSQSKIEETKSGRLKYVETLRYGSVGTHGSKGWYVDDREFSINGRKFSPEKIDVNETIGDCEASPNETIEVLKCYSFEKSNETVFLLRMKNDKPVWTTLYQDAYIKSNGKNLGEWIDDGRGIIFKDFIYKIEPDEKSAIENLPAYPEEYFRAVSPDLKTIVFQGFCFNKSAEVSIETKKLDEKLCAESDRLYKNKVEVLWLIEGETGAIKLLELSRDKYDWLNWNQNKFEKRSDWLKFFQRQIVWEKDKDGKFQFVAPK